jgi:cytohesin
MDATESRRGQTALMWAVEQGHIDTARALIEHRANVNARSKSGFTALLFAAQQNDRAIVELLLGAGADVNAATSAPSSAAGPPAGTTALLIAAASGHEDLALYLLEKGANPNTADNNGASAMHYAVRKGMIMMVSDQQSIDLADLTTWHNMVDLTRALLARGANPNARLARNVGRMAINTAGATPFMLATISGDIPLMRMLVASGADPKLATNANVTAFMLAAGVGWAARAERTEEEVRNGLDAAKMLLAFGADVNAAGEYKWTPLHGAAYTGSDAIVEFLVENGAKIDAKDVWEQTPLSIAQGFASILIDDFTKKTQGPHPSTAALLQKLGAPPWVPPVRPDAVAPPVTGRGNP